MGYFKNLWSALIGTSNKKAVKKNKYAPAKTKIQTKEKNIEIDKSLFDKLYTFSEVANILNISNQRLSNLLSQHKKTFGHYLLEKRLFGRARATAVYTINDIDKIKNSHYYKLTKNKRNYK
jgi:hypothetical protein